VSRFPLKIPAAWPKVTGFQFLEGHPAHARMHRLAERAPRYLQPPHAGPDHAICAVVCLQFPRTNPVDDVATVVVTPQGTGKQRSLMLECSCHRSMACLHSLSLVLDLSIMPELHQAVVAGKDFSSLLVDLPGRREDWLSAQLASTLLTPWLAEPRIPAEKPPYYTLETSWSADYRTPRPSRGQQAELPTLFLACLVEGHKRPLKFADIQGAPLPEHDRVLLGFCAPSDEPGFPLQVTGGAASVVLDMLQHRRVELGSHAGAPMQFTQEALHPALARRSVPAHWFDEWRNARPEETLEHADALVAEWVREDGTTVGSMLHSMLFDGAAPRVILLDKSLVAPLAAGVDRAVALKMQRIPVLPIKDGGNARAVFLGLRRVMRGRHIALPLATEMDAADVAQGTFTLRLEGSPLEVKARLLAAYPFGTVPAAPGAAAQDPRRDPESETAAISAVERAGFHHVEEGTFWATDDDAVTVWRESLVQLRACAAPPLDVQIAENLKNLRVKAPVQVNVTASLMGGWLDTQVELNIQGLKTTIQAVRDAINNKRKWLVLDDGTISLLQERVTQLIEEGSDALDEHGRARLPPHHLGRVAGWLQDADEVVLDSSVQAWRQTLKTGMVASEIREPRGFTGTLRPYQTQGVAWLQFLEKLGVGGVLADDMGLGKTVQVLAWLCSLTPSKTPSLVICPTSVASNWVREAQHFAPSLKTLLWHGQSRATLGAPFEKADLVITTYGVVRQDQELLSAAPWRALIVDEAQFIKNADAVTTRIVKQLSAQHRVALTGTPVENRLLELWSIMDLCNPGMLGSRRRFERRTEKEIARDGDGYAARRLRLVVKPFLLRRSKSQVLPELPDKQEVDRLCVPGVRQRALYDATAAMARANLRKKMEREWSERLPLRVLAAFTRLRQMACDPRLIDPTEKPEHSTKRQEFMTLVDALVAEGRRVLVFSQFVELLQWWGRDLQHAGLSYEYLDGSTRDREAVVRRFQDGDAPLFLISLKAGGTGLNLTAADTVIHCDPWWNPAVEDQASDRAHRIGQTRKVTVYRLVARGTIEERIMQLKGKKRGLAQAILSGEGALQGLTDDDVNLLLGDVDAAIPVDEGEGAA